MGKRNLHFLLLMIACWVLLPTEVKAQNTYGYSSINYDPDSNTITAYSETNPDYNTQAYYYNSYVNSTVKDASGNQLASQNALGSVSFSLSGNGSDSYTISSGHYMLLSYALSNVYSPCNNQYYYYAYYDYYNYLNFNESPTPDGVVSLYLFFGPGPVCYTPSVDIVLGGSTDSDYQPNPPAAHPVNFHETNHYDAGNGTLHFDYAWDSSTGVMSDLINCTTQEIVSYTPRDLPFKSPPFPAGIDPINPTVKGGPAYVGSAPDDHSTPGNFVRPYSTKTIIAVQTYQYICSGVNGGNPVRLYGPLKIVRSVSQNSNGSWKFTITKSGASASINPLP
jgi:hypothetical protein